MLDPKEQQKGGFGAFAARHHEQLASSDATGDPVEIPTDAVPSDVELPPPAPPTPVLAEPRRQRFFRSIL